MSDGQATGQVRTTDQKPDGAADSAPQATPDNRRNPKRKPRNLRRLILCFLGALALYFTWQTVSISRYGFRDNGRNTDCAIVLGGAAWHDKPSPVFRERLNHAIKLYQEGRVTALVLTGGKGTGAPYSEGEVARHYCLQRGIPGNVLFVESRSRTTIQNLEEAKNILDQQGFASALIVSDPWHLKRGVLIARRQGIEASPSGTTTSRFESMKSRASFTLRELYLYHLHLLFGR
ncbi:MAG: YdcF family protein [Roseibacillus sp.]|jgi:uncharacterized SAM-binding protein YcdF (DUF218 family)|nr:YdcF family protein [Roseibacillus sp.]MDP7306605.1 YdcF family protein [Roseibacillus sp.]HJM62252.1 YdcF family protein [Roseibacillus sp.]|tara:strand:+ start:4911 stop:5609 length:699 start_codon:yes stop_codon:yes gene_type:complete